LSARSKPEIILLFYNNKTSSRRQNNDQFQKSPILENFVSKSATNKN